MRKLGLATGELVVRGGKEDLDTAAAGQGEEGHAGGDGEVVLADSFGIERQAGVPPSFL